MNKIVNYGRQVRRELTKVVTPSRGEVVRDTGVVLGFVLVLTAAIVGIDIVFGAFVNMLTGVA